jgi:DNA-directed RNA polymerase subunit N (RpoN/RPB10)
MGSPPLSRFTNEQDRWQVNKESSNGSMLQPHWRKYVTRLKQREERLVVDRYCCTTPFFAQSSHRSDDLNCSAHRACLALTSHVACTQSQTQTRRANPWAT